MSLLVGRLVEAEGPYPVRGVGHDWPGTAIIEPASQLGTVVGLVTEKPLGRLCPPDEALSRRAIMGLAAGQEDGKKTASSI